ncbi:PREDICTED: uncharacterized protein LOC108529969 [Rhinopithecus bieti]|uniref:uncharacterized protein LOC108529969 n=1 Tax=Rhinopithecus bieti TaxID=61621 RepID=UPI00083C6E56|nr:PREDICTED: uncharacterized protein LOC108529969 [Rhinopithecus bieti]
MRCEGLQAPAPPREPPPAPLLADPNRAALLAPLLRVSAAPVFLFPARRVLVVQAESSEGGKAARSPRQLQFRPPGSRCANKGICMKTETRFAERTRWRGASCAPVPYRCAPFPRWGRSEVWGLAQDTARQAGTGTLRPERPPSLPTSQAGGNGRLGRGRASADSSGRFTEACGQGARGLGEPAPACGPQRSGRSGGSVSFSTGAQPPGSPCATLGLGLFACSTGTQECHNAYLQGEAGFPEACRRVARRGAL